MKYQEIKTENNAIQEDENFLEERKEMIEELFEKTETYIKTNVSLLKLKALDKSAIVTSALVANLLLLLLFLFFILMLSTGVAFWIGFAFGKIHVGFLLMAALYALLTIAYFAFGKKKILQYISDRFIAGIDK